MRLSMLSTRHGSPDGIHIHEYEAGREYGPETQPRMTPALAALFIREGWARDLDALPDRKPPRAKEYKSQRSE